MKKTWKSASALVDHKNIRAIKIQSAPQMIGFTISKTEAVRLANHLLLAAHQTIDGSVLVQSNKIRREKPIIVSYRAEKMVARRTKRVTRVNTLVNKVGQQFRTFGGGRDSEYNPITHALKDQPPSFAAGVDVREVVEFVLGERY